MYLFDHTVKNTQQGQTGLWHLLQTHSANSLFRENKIKVGRSSNLSVLLLGGFSLGLFACTPAEEEEPARRRERQSGDGSSQTGAEILHLSELPFPVSLVDLSVTADLVQGRDADWLMGIRWAHLVQR